MRNMKIPVENNLDEIVGELERLGYFKGCWWIGFANITIIEADGETGHLVDYRGNDIDARYGDLTTLAELKEM